MTSTILRTDNRRDTSTNDEAFIASSELHSVSLLLKIPTQLLSEIVEYCSLTDGRRLFHTCRSLMCQYSSILEYQRRLIRVDPTNTRPGPFDYRYLGKALNSDLRILLYPPLWRNYESVVTLDLGKLVTNEVIQSLHARMPLLRDLLLVGSCGVSSILSLGRNSYWRRHLRLLDITLCNSVHYRQTLFLRDVLHADLVIRRQPKWMDGNYVTPFKNDGIHTYWADGSFSFQRSDKNCGYVRDLWLEDSSTHRYGKTFQFTYVHRYLPTVSVQPTLPQLDMSSASTEASEASVATGASTKKMVRTVLVTQCFDGSHPPSDFPKPEQGQHFPIGVTQYFRREEDGLPVFEESATHHQEARADHVIVTRMEVTPLVQDMPPHLVVNQIDKFCARVADDAQNHGPRL